MLLISIITNDYQKDPRRRLFLLRRFFTTSTLSLMVLLSGQVALFTNYGLILLHLQPLSRVNP